MKTTIKEIFENNNWIITKVMQGIGGNIRIDAKTRHHKADAINRASIWCSFRYANTLAKENYGKKINEFNCFSY